MLNLIPAILMLLASGPFGPPSGDAIARIEALAPKARVVQLAIELERAGLTAAQAVLVMVSCEESPTERVEVSATETSSLPLQVSTTHSGFAQNARSRDGPNV